MVAGPEKPACASAAACRPAHAAQPVWKRFVQEPSARNSIEPAAWLPAMPSAAAITAASSPSTAPAAAAAPKAPQVEGAALMRVVHLEGMRRRAVGERRVRCGEALRRAEHGRAALEPERREPAAEDDARLLARTAERHAEMVAQQIERARDDVRRQRPVADPDGFAAELLGERHEGVSRAALTWRRQAAKRSSR